MPNRQTIKLYLNVGHTFDHLFMLIFPTVVLAISAEWQRPYSELLPLSLPGFIPFGVFSLPAGVENLRPVELCRHLQRCL